MLGSDPDSDKVKHLFYHLALAANKLEAKKEIGAAISKSSVVEKKTIYKIKGVGKKRKSKSKPGKLKILKRISKRLASIEKKIKRIKKEGSYDHKRLHKIEIKVEIIKRRIKILTRK